MPSHLHDNLFIYVFGIRIGTKSFNFDFEPMLASYWFLEELSRLGLELVFRKKEDHPILGLVNIFKKANPHILDLDQIFLINNSKFDMSNIHKIL
jgi:hypothetical protein